MLNWITSCLKNFLISFLIFLCIIGSKVFYLTIIKKGYTKLILYLITDVLPMSLLPLKTISSNSFKRFWIGLNTLSTFKVSSIILIRIKVNTRLIYSYSLAYIHFIMLKDLSFSSYRVNTILFLTCWFLKTITSTFIVLFLILNLNFLKLYINLIFDNSICF